MIDPRPGDIFRKGEVLNNTYEIEGVLGRGGTGEVYRARNQITGRVMAIKALNREFSQNADYLELMKREEEMRDIAHDAVVRYTDCNRTADGHVYLVMDFVDGVPLSDWLERGGASARDLLVVAHRVAEGLVATHARRIVHRDLSPDNIILRGGEPEQAVIIDFGIAKDTKAGARTIVGNEFAGKYEYAAPEQLDGRSEPRSDLYALGTSLLAVFRGRVPEVGSSPGEVVRAKQHAPDTAGVPEPLKTLLDDLTRPDPARRPPSAAAVVAAIDRMLRPASSRAAKARTAGARMLWPVLGLVAVALVAGGLWVSGALERFFADPLPLVAPYTLTASIGEDGAALTGHAPDAAQRGALTGRLAALADVAPSTDALTLALGAPTETWAGDVAALMTIAGALDEWTLELVDREVALTGIAPDAETRDAVAERFAAAAEGAGFAPRARIAAGPRALGPGYVAAQLRALATCGPLAPVPPEGETWPLDATVTITGSVARSEDLARIEAELAPRIGDRGLRLDVSVLNPELCTVRALLPAVAPGGLTIALGYGDDPEPNLSGIYSVGDNPVIDVLAPADATTGYLWVAIADVTGNLFNILPNINRPENAIAELGALEDGVRRIRAAYALSEQATDPKKLAFSVDATFGKSLVLVLLTDAPLFDELRPTTESVESFAQALGDALATGDVEVLSLTTRLIDSRG